MSKNVDYLKKIYSRFYEESLDDPSRRKVDAAIQVLKTYGIKRHSSHEQMAHYMADILHTILHDVDTFASRMQVHEHPVFDYFIFGLQQALGFIHLKTTITEDIVMSPELVMTRKQVLTLYHAFHRQINFPSFELQKNLLGVMISIYVNKTQLTTKNSGFASACFVVAKELNLQNISHSVWRKLITAANFPGSFLGKVTSSSRRAVAMAQFTEGLPAYSLDDNLARWEYEPMSPPNYEPPPNYILPDFMEENIMGQTLYQFETAHPDEPPPTYRPIRCSTP